MNTLDKFYVASCVFTEEYPALSKKICDYVREEKIVAYCHYCVRGLKLGGAKAYHLAELLF